MSEVKKVFSVGDIVSFAGVKGEVISNESTGSDIRIHGSSVSITTPILVLFENGKQDNFTEDGKLDITHIEPLLSLVKKVEDRRLIVKTMFRAVISNDSGSPAGNYSVGNGLYNTTDEVFKSKVFTFNGGKRACGYMPVEIVVYE